MKGKNKGSFINHQYTIEHSISEAVQQQRQAADWSTQKETSNYSLKQV